MDYIARALTMDGKIRVYAAVTTECVEAAAKIHGCTPTTAAALGRTLTGALLAASMGDDGSLTLQIDGKGPAGKLIAVATPQGVVKATIDNPAVELPLNAKGKLDVGGAVGHSGKLTVVRDVGLAEPHVGQTALVSGEIAEDLTAYYAYSEQTPSVVALGVLVDVDYSIKAAGGYIIQLMPGADEATIEMVEAAVNQAEPVTTMIAKGLNPEQLIEELLPDCGVLFYENILARCQCDCSRERIEKALISLGKAELSDIIETDGKAELVCHFCNKKYQFGKEDLQNLLEQATKE